MTEPPDVIKAASWFEGPVKKSFASVFDGINAAVESLDLLRKYRKAHFGSLEVLDTVKLIGMSSTKPLRELYWPVELSSTINSRLYRDDWQKIKHDPAAVMAAQEVSPTELRSAVAVYEENPRIVVLGGPGSGKTTLLRRLALALCNKEDFARMGMSVSRFPIYIHLPTLADLPNTSIFDYVSSRLVTQTDLMANEFLKRVFRNGLAAFFLDSLDEVPMGKVSAIITEIKNAVSAFPKNKYVVACRTADYDGSLDAFSEVELAGLSDEAIKSIVNRWFDEKKKAEDLLTRMMSDSDIKSLARTPLLLSLICVQYRHDLALPRRKTELFRRCVDALLREWDTSRGFRRDTAYASLSDEHKERIFEEIAGTTFLTDQTYILREQAVVQHVVKMAERLKYLPENAGGIVREIERHHGILERFSAECYVFSHPSFQDYFAARYFIRHRQEMQIVRKHCQVEHWNSVIEFMASILDDPDALLEAMIQHSKLDNLSTYPAMAKRMGVVCSLYRCMILGAATSYGAEKGIWKHIVESKNQASRIYAESMTYPYLRIVNDVIAPTYFYLNTMRKTLAGAMTPMRRLADDIFRNPLPGYADYAIEYSEALVSQISHLKTSPMRARERERDRVSQDSLFSLLRLSSLLSWIAVPLTPGYPKEICALLEAATADSFPGYSSLISNMFGPCIAFAKKIQR